ncbi:MAG: cobalamin biosynthesis protein, partial [Proteobacteria bacterium]
MYLESCIVLLLAFIIDQTLGEYPNAVHPVVWMGKCIKFSEKFFLGKSESVEKAGGIAIAVIVPGLFWLVSFLALASLGDAVLRITLAVLLLKASFALKALIAAAKSVEENLGKDLIEARNDLRSLCSRDASQLTEEELVEGAASSLAENLCDSVVAPIFYFCIGGVPLAIAYRVINTMDAM